MLHLLNFKIAKNKYDLKKKLKVTFVGEPGLDLGGLTKEWFLLLLRELFRPEYGLFVFNKQSGNYWFNLTAKDSKLKELNLIGVVSSFSQSPSFLYIFSLSSFSSIPRLYLHVMCCG